MNTAADLFESPQFQAREFFVEVDHPAAGKLRYPGWPIKLGSGTRLELAPAPLLGQDNQSILGEDGLALSRQEMVSLGVPGIFRP